MAEFQLTPRLVLAAICTLRLQAAEEDLITAKANADFFEVRRLRHEVARLRIFMVEAEPHIAKALASCPTQLAT